MLGAKIAKSSMELTMLTCDKVFKCNWFKKCRLHLESGKPIETPDLRRSRKKK